MGILEGNGPGGPLKPWLGGEPARRPAIWRHSKCARWPSRKGWAAGISTLGTETILVWTPRATRAAKWRIAAARREVLLGKVRRWGLLLFVVVVVVAVVVGVIDLARHCLDEVETAVPVTHRSGQLECFDEHKKGQLKVDWSQKEGNGEYPHGFCALGRLLSLHPKCYITGIQDKKKRRTAYSNDGWVLGHGRRGLFFGRLFNAQVLDIAAHGRQSARRRRRRVGNSSLPPLRPSVPNERTLSSETVEASELISTRVPTYLLKSIDRKCACSGGRRTECRS